MQTNVTLMTPDPSVASAVAAALQSNGHVLIGAAAADVRDLAAQLTKSSAPIALIDLDPEPGQVLPYLERLVARFPGTRFVGLSSTLGNELLLEAMQSGIRRVVVKQTIGAELSGVLDRMTPADGGNVEPAGTLVTVLSASGGCGATTIAVNLEEIAIEAKAPTLLCDLDLSYGAVAGYLGVRPHYAVDHILDYAGAIDGQLIRSTATIHSERLHVLASPYSSSFGAVEGLKYERLEHALRAARQAYGATVVDAPRVGLGPMVTLASASARTLLVFQLTVKDLRTARAMLDGLRDRGVDLNSVIPVANRYVKRQLISPEEAGKALGGLTVHLVRNDYVPAIESLNFGKPLSESAPRSNLRKDLQELAGKLQLVRSN